MNTSLSRDPIRTSAWQLALAEAYTDPAALLADLGLADHGIDVAEATRFAMRVPRAYARRMRHADPRDPLLLQVLPRQAESEEVPGFGTDPVGDLASARRPGLLQKYAGRALIVTTGACAVHCRYCFRRAYPYQDNLPDSQFAGVLEELRDDPGLTEVILSGGDPLSLSNRRLGLLLTQLDAIEHVRRIRLHTRTPIVLPERIDSGLLSSLAAARTPVVMVLHTNHANEIDDAVTDAIRQLRKHCVALLNQAVLLRGINDSASALSRLSENLFAAGVLPYYLHQLDPVSGAAHFAVTDDRARECLRGAAAQLPGYLVPRLVREVAGAEAKLPL
mgnify:CR=1 FL=1